MENKVFLKNLEKLIYDDKHFSALNLKTNSIEKHIFSIINKEHDELTFSRTLKFFLDPNEDHLLYDFFIRRFLHYLIKSNEDYFDNINISRLSIDTLDFKNTKVFREYSIGENGRLDIYINISDDIHVLIENKLLSAEGIEQTLRYKQWADSKLNKKKVIYCFITPEGLQADCLSFLSISFDDLLKIFSDFNYDSKLNQRINFILNNFLNWIKEYTVMDKETKKICRSIYNKHKETLDLLIKNIPSVQAFMTEISSQINLKSNDYIGHNGSSWTTVSPKSWVKNTLLKASSKYSKLRYEYAYNQNTETIVMQLVVPEDEFVKKWVSDHSITLFKVSPELISPVKNWGQYYYKIEENELILENLIDDFEDKADVFASKLLTLFEKSIKECFNKNFENEWLEQLKKN